MRLWLHAAACALALGACGADTLRLESAGAVSTASTAVVDASRQALAELRDRRARANAVIVASDPSCSAATIVHIRVAPGGPLCSDGPDPTGNSIPLDTRPVTEASIQPTLVLIAAFADYAAVLQKTVGEPNRDIASELAALAGKANEARAFAEALLGATIPEPAEALATKQAQSAVKLAQFASDLAQEAGKVRRIRQIVAERDAQVGTVAAELDQQVKDWLAFARTDADDVVGRLRTVYDSQVRSVRGFEQRLAFVDMVQAARADAGQVETRAKAMSAAVTLLAEARESLANHLAGRFTNDERLRIAAIERKRIGEALRLLAQAATAFI